MTKTWGVTGPVSVWGIAHEDTDDMEWLLLSEGWGQFIYICFIFYLFYSYIIITFFICSLFILLLHFSSFFLYLLREGWLQFMITLVVMAKTLMMTRAMLRRIIDDESLMKVQKVIFYEAR